MFIQIIRTKSYVQPKEIKLGYSDVFIKTLNKIDDEFLKENKITFQNWFENRKKRHNKLLNNLKSS